MKQYLLFGESGSTKCDSLIEMFQALSVQGHFVNSIEDGVLNTTGGDFSFAIIEPTDLTKDFVEAVKVYRQELRDSVSMFKKQGMPLSAEQIETMVKQFQFIADNESSGKEAPVEETTTPVDTPAEAPAETPEPEPVKDAAPAKEEKKKAGRPAKKKVDESAGDQDGLPFDD